MLPYDLTEKAREEFEQAYEYYKDKRPGLGGDFAEDVYNAIQDIQAMPNGYVGLSEWHGARRKVMKKFPYHIFYLAEAEKITILSIWPQAANPEGWQAER